MRRSRLVGGVAVVLAAVFVGAMLAGCAQCDVCGICKPKCPPKQACYTKDKACNGSTYSSNWSKQRGSDGSTMVRSGSSILDVAKNTPTLSTFARALQAADLAGQFRAGGPYTVFAPSDEAFAKLPAGTLDTWLKPENRDLLRNILMYHVTGGDMFSSDISGSRRINTLANEPIRITSREGTIFADNARIVQPDLQASNGVIHVIDRVLTPPGQGAAGQQP